MDYRFLRTQGHRCTLLILKVYLRQIILTYVVQVMRYQKYTPSPHLAAFVECYFVWEKRDPLTVPLRIESPPAGFGSIVFNLGNDYRVRTAKTNRIAPTAFLTGQATTHYELELAGRIGMVGVVFRPAGLHSLFGLPMYEFTNERVSLFDVLGTLIGSLPDQLA